MTIKEMLLLAEQIEKHNRARITAWKKQQKGSAMMKQPFELFIGFTGPGYSYCNKAIEHDGEYKKIAFVDAYTGKISWYQRPESIPGSALLRIEHDSDLISARAEFS